MADEVLCPCGSHKPKAECCGPILEGTRLAETAEQLMRARYSAYAVCDLDFLFRSSGPDAQKDFDAESSRKWAEGSTWLGMEVVATEKGGPQDDEGYVEFVARYQVNKTEFEHHERSLFRRIDGAWRFIDGELVKPKPIQRETPKVGRNDPCPCGSGKKFKKCCGKDL